MKQILLHLIRFYQKWISPMKTPCCRFYPTCSRYALDSVERFGAFRGSILAIWRILRCNPWNIGGVDKVPTCWKDPFPLVGLKSKNRKNRQAGTPENTRHHASRFRSP